MDEKIMEIYSVRGYNKDVYEITDDVVINKNGIDVVTGQYQGAAAVKYQSLRTLEAVVRIRHLSQWIL